MGSGFGDVYRFQVRDSMGWLRDRVNNAFVRATIDKRES
jgi:hypothetical protein